MFNFINTLGGFQNQLPGYIKGMKPDKINDELATIQNSMTLQKLARHNLPLFVGATSGLAGGIIFFMWTAMSAARAAGHQAMFSFIALGLICTGIALVFFTLLLFGPKGAMSKNLSKRLERQKLDELNEEELHTLIEFHSSQKNLDAADQVSKYLMLKVDKDEAEEKN